MKQSVRKSVDVQFFKSVDMPESQSYQGVAGSGGDMAYTISSADPSTTWVHLRILIVAWKTVRILLAFCVFGILPRLWASCLSPRLHRQRSEAADAVGAP